MSPVEHLIRFISLQMYPKLNPEGHATISSSGNVENVVACIINHNFCMNKRAV